ncbi:hypothetical protein GOV11_00965 [Candidatus Woesearchaeota archaeon]|nr:hypothetical protein [Candidatus Woesearchaeota archaeon]
MKRKGWFNDSWRHSLSARGVKTVPNKYMAKRYLAKFVSPAVEIEKNGKSAEVYVTPLIKSPQIPEKTRLNSLVEGKSFEHERAFGDEFKLPEDLRSSLKDDLKLNDFETDLFELKISHKIKEARAEVDK